jgi:hypothetical protein
MPKFAFRPGGPGDKIDKASLHVGRIVYTGHTHLEAFNKASKFHKEEDIDKQLRERPESEGFLTKSGFHLGRAEALKLAKKSKQLWPGVTNDDTEGLLGIEHLKDRD